MLILCTHILGESYKIMLSLFHDLCFVALHICCHQQLFPVDALCDDLPGVVPQRGLSRSWTEAHTTCGAIDEDEQQQRQRVRRSLWGRKFNFYLGGSIALLLGISLRTADAHTV